ncbi:MAG: alanine/ornithine racemase family PLP-dependent enzyme [Peptostreptococcaceae bacterium]
MSSEAKYPLLEIDLNKIYENAKYITDICKGLDISIAGVIKGLNAQTGVVEKLIEGGCEYIASSRIEQLVEIKEKGFDKEVMLIRMPMQREIVEVVKNIDISLNSELETIKKLNRECEIQNKTHKIILMMDLGDLREGFIDEEELIDTAVYIESNLKYIKLYGVGTNLSCYGSIKPSFDNLNKLCQVAEGIEEKISRKLDIVSGGATTTLPLIFENNIPERINNLRVGEAILIGRDLVDYWGYNDVKLHTDTLKLKAEIIELKKKPSYPIGEMFIDAFGNKPTYEDRGIKTRAILGIGKQDFVSHSSLIPLTEGVEVIGSSSDHLIVEINNNVESFKVGDIITFGMYYPNALYLTASNYVTKEYI